MKLEIEYLSDQDFETIDKLISLMNSADIIQGGPYTISTTIQKMEVLDKGNAREVSFKSKFNDNGEWAKQD
jgi:hypothetical protein